MSSGFQPAQWEWELGGAVLSLVAAALTKLAAEYQRRRTETWPISYGKIVDVTVEEIQGTGRLQLHYSYSIAEERYAGIFKKTLADESEATAWANALHGAQVAVRYDPGKPSRSRLWESDLETTVRASVGSQYRKDATPLSGWEQVLIYPCLVIALVGVIASVATIAAVLMGKPVLHHKTGWLNPVGVLVLLITFFVARKGGIKTISATPGWMKFLSYAVVYFTIFGAFVVPRLRSNSGSNPERARQQRLISDANYTLLIYFGAFEACYARLNSARQRGELQSGINANSVG